jgi:hypothetical protein
MDRQSQWLTPLQQLVSELAQIPDWPSVEIDAAMLMYDVLLTLRCSPRDIACVLGTDATRYIAAKLGEVSRLGREQ